jgi:hypothetical protein
MNAHQKLTAARQRQAEIELAISMLGNKRKEMLLADDRTEPIVSIDKDISDLRALAQIEADRVEGLGEEIKNQQVAAAQRRKQATIDRLEKKLNGTVDLAKELEATIGKSVEIFHRIVKARGEFLPVFARGDSEVAIAVDNFQGAALTGGSIAALVKFELFRQGAQPWGATVPGLQQVPSFPGGVSPGRNLDLTPEKVPSLATAIANASRYAINLMRGGRAPGLLSEQADESRSPAAVKLGELLAKQVELAEDPDREAEYFAVMAEIVPLQSQVDAEREAMQAVAAERQPETRSPDEVKLDQLRRQQVSMVEHGIYSSAEYSDIMRQIAPLAEMIEQARKQGAQANG